MTILCCTCLNVKVHGDPASRVSVEGETEDILTGFDRVVTLGLAGVRVEHPYLVRMRRIARFVVLNCANCSNDLLAAPVAELAVSVTETADTNETLLFQQLVGHKGELLLHKSVMTSSDADFVRQKPGYSELFRVVINSLHTQEQFGSQGLVVDSEFDAVLRSLDATVKSVFAQKEQQMQERIRKFAEEQRLLFNQEYSRAQTERQQLWLSICAVNTDRLRSKSKPSILGPIRIQSDNSAIAEAPSSATAAVSDIPTESPLDDDNGYTLSFTERSVNNDQKASTVPAIISVQTIESVKEPIQSTSIFVKKRNYSNGADIEANPTMFAIDGFEDTDQINGNDDETTAEEEVDNTDTESDADSIMQAPPPSLASSLMYASSLPMEIPRAFQNRNASTLSQSAVSNALKPFAQGSLVVASSLSLASGNGPVSTGNNSKGDPAAILEAIVDDDDDDDDENGAGGSKDKFIAPHQLAARTYVDETSVLFGERPRPPTFDSTKLEMID